MGLSHCFRSPFLLQRTTQYQSAHCQASIVSTFSLCRRTQPVYTTSVKEQLQAFSISIGVARGLAGLVVAGSRLDGGDFCSLIHERWYAPALALYPVFPRFCSCKNVGSKEDWVYQCTRERISIHISLLFSVKKCISFEPLPRRIPQLYTYEIQRDKH